MLRRHNQKEKSGNEYLGNKDTFLLLTKEFSEKEGWTKTTKAMEIENVGCVVQVTTQNKDNVAEALVFVPRSRIEEIFDEGGSCVGRKVVSIDA